MILAFFILRVVVDIAFVVYFFARAYKTNHVLHYLAALFFVGLLGEALIQLITYIQS